MFLNTIIIDLTKTFKIVFALIRYMNKMKILGLIFVFLSMILSLANIFSVKITGAIIGIGVKSSLITIFTLVFLFLGIFFLGNLEKKVSNWVKAAAIAGSIGLIAAPAYHARKDKLKKRTKENVEINKEVKVVSPYMTTQGRFERTYRWDKILDEIEDKYELPRGILKGLVMRESYGDPLRLNAMGDGGAGLFMFQPRTAKAYGLKVHGTSDRSSADKAHGAELKELVKKHNYDYGKLAVIDERFDVRKSAEAAAKYLRDDFKRYGSWDKALSAYNQGKPAPNASETKHVKAVREYQAYYNERDKKDHKYSTQKTNAKSKAKRQRKR